MRVPISLYALAVAAVLPLLMPTPGFAQQSQQDKMKTCNTQATSQNLTGDARKNFMSNCLKGASSGSSTGNTQQDKMKTCNTQATAQNLSGSARRNFVNNCLKGS
jgi:psiF repeat